LSFFSTSGPSNGASNQENFEMQGLQQMPTNRQQISQHTAVSTPVVSSLNTDQSKEKHFAQDPKMQHGRQRKFQEMQPQKTTGTGVYCLINEFHLKASVFIQASTSVTPSVLQVEAAALLLAARTEICPSLA
jgi:hypothetical protein